MKAIYLREQQCYSKSELYNIIASYRNSVAREHQLQQKDFLQNNSEGITQNSTASAIHDNNTSVIQDKANVVGGATQDNPEDVNQFNSQAKQAQEQGASENLAANGSLATVTDDEILKTILVKLKNTRATTPKTKQQQEPNYADLAPSFQEVDYLVAEKINSYNWDEVYYTFNFVGMVIVEDIIIFCYPKYIPEQQLTIIDSTLQTSNVLERLTSESDSDSKGSANGESTNGESTNVVSIDSLATAGLATGGLATDELSATQLSTAQWSTGRLPAAELSPAGSHSENLSAVKFITRDSLSAATVTLVTTVDSLNETELLAHVKLTLKVINKYNQEKHKEQEQYLAAEHDYIPNSSHLVSVMLSLFQDYLDNGLYNSQEEVLEFNGNNDIHWDRTINQVTPHLINQRPYYLQWFSHHKINNELDFIRRVHASVISEIVDYFERRGLLDIFDLPAVMLSSDLLVDLDDLSFIIAKLNHELTNVFAYHKQLILHNILTYLEKRDSLLNNNAVTLYGTSSFAHVWEKVCQVIIGDSRNEFQDIDNPVWHFDGQEFTKRTLRPDIVFRQDNKLYIIDAKYYLPNINDTKLEQIPDLSSLTKQYLYHLALQQSTIATQKKNRDTTTDQESDNQQAPVANEIINAFLFPSFNKQPQETSPTLVEATDANPYLECKGKVEFGLFNKSPLELTPIQLLFLDVTHAYQKYLTNGNIKLGVATKSANH